MLASDSTQYVGRFAPSPTGPLHFGSLLTAVASYLQAKSRAGRWLLRIEDIDPSRQKTGAIEEILTSLEFYGFEWDEPITYQSDHVTRYHQVIADLIAADLAYPCSCSRQNLATAEKGPLGTIYPGTCRNGCQSDQFALRVRTNNAIIKFVDVLQGIQCQRLESESGDFVIQRRDGPTAYHLAVVIDDFDQGITEVVRGVDLLHSTPRQIHLQRVLGYQTPTYFHIPIVKNSEGQKLSKFTGASAIPLQNINQTLVSALYALGQQPPLELVMSSLDDIWTWSIKNWHPSVMVSQTAIIKAEEALV
jgi:glutamyl-Q tRNA(Asp) synthetase